MQLKKYRSNNRLKKKPVKIKLKKTLQLKNPTDFFSSDCITFALSKKKKKKNKRYCDTEKGKEKKKNLAIQWRIVRSDVRPRGNERQREVTRKRGKKKRGDEIEDETWDTEKETEKGEELCIDSATFTV